MQVSTSTLQVALPSHSEGQIATRVSPLNSQSPKSSNSAHLITELPEWRVGHFLEQDHCSQGSVCWLFLTSPAQDLYGSRHSVGTKASHCLYPLSFSKLAFLLNMDHGVCTSRIPHLLLLLGYRRVEILLWGILVGEVEDTAFCFFILF